MALRLCPSKSWSGHGPAHWPQRTHFARKSSSAVAGSTKPPRIKSPAPGGRCRKWLEDFAPHLLEPAHKPSPAVPRVARPSAANPRRERLRAMEDMLRGQIRNPKSEIRKKAEGRNPKDVVDLEESRGEATCPSERNADFSPLHLSKWPAPGDVCPARPPLPPVPGTVARTPRRAFGLRASRFLCHSQVVIQNSLRRFHPHGALLVVGLLRDRAVGVEG